MMSLLLNHCWCSDSNWGGHYNCRTILTIDYVQDGKSYHDGPTEDWKNLLEDDVPFENPERIGRFETVRLKSEVIEWLKANVKDVEGEDHKQGWCIGTDKYNATSGISFNIFFQRVSDAKAFAKKWSSYKNLFGYLNYFADKRYKLNLKTGRLQRTER
jgi:hypothetical protein